MLHHLLDLAEESEPGFAAEAIRWQVELTAGGKLLGVLPLGDGKRGELHKKVPKMHNMSAGGRAHFLIETAQTVSLYFKENEDDEKKEATAEKRRFYADLMKQAATNAPLLEGIEMFLRDSNALATLRNQLVEKGAKPSDWLKFVIGGNDPLADITVLDWWREWRKRDLATSNAGGSASEIMIDLLTGDPVAPVGTHPKITGLASVGGLPTGDVVAGFDKDAFQSYGLDQSKNAAVSETTARRYVDALSGLVRETGTKFAGALVVHWFKERLRNTEDDPLSFLLGRESLVDQAAGAQIRAKELLMAIRAGQRPDLANNHYYAMTLSGAAGRVMVRDWMEGQFEDLVQNVFEWFFNLEIVNIGGLNVAKDPKLESVVTCLLQPRKQNQNYDDWVKPLGAARAALLQNALRGTPIPFNVISRLAVLLPAFLATKDLNDQLDRAFRRKKIDAESERGDAKAPLLISLLQVRMGLIKAYFIHKGGNHGMNAYLNPEHPEPAYHCGRLLAVLNSLQRSALGDVGAGVVQRYYTAASQTPALIIGRLMSNAKNHLGKLDGGLAYWYEDKIADIMSRIRDSAPRTLDLEHQSLFALGYYQQLAHDRTGKPNKTDSTNNRED